MTKTGDIEKTFSGLKNLAVLQGFGTKNPNELGWYRQTFLTTPTAKLAEATELWLLERTRKFPSVVSVGSSSTSPRVASVTSSAPPVEELVLQSSKECLPIPP